MAVLLMRLIAPMQSWGIQSRFSDRDTGLEPSKSGIVGILAAALGRQRNQSILDLTELHLGVRVDKEGQVKTDFHTALNVRKANRSSHETLVPHQSSPDTVVSHRHYLSDAKFLVGLSGDVSFLIQLELALRHPIFPLYLGRKSFVPTQSLVFPIRPTGFKGPNKAPSVIEGDLKEILTKFPLITKKSQDAQYLRIIFESNTGGSIRSDFPLAFDQRKFKERYAKTEWLDLEKTNLSEYSEIPDAEISKEEM